MQRGKKNLYALEEVILMRKHADLESWFYWSGYKDYLDGGHLRGLVFNNTSDGKKGEAAYFMGYADAKGDEDVHSS